MIGVGRNLPGTNGVINVPQLLFVSLPAAMQYVKAGRLKALAVTSDQRSIAAPDIPTIAESGIDCIVNSWYGALVPAKTPPAIVVKLQAAFAKVLAMPDMKEREAQLGYRYIGGPPEKLAAFLNNEIAKWAEVAKSVALK